MQKLNPRRVVAVTTAIPEGWPELWVDEEAPFFVNPRVPPTTRFLADVLRAFGFPSGIASLIQTQAANIFGKWIHHTPNIAANLDEGSDPMLGLYIIDNGDAVEGGEAEVRAARKFAEIRISFCQVEEEEE